MTILKDFREYRKHKKTIEDFKKNYKVEETMPELEWVYTSNDGTKWFQFKDPLQISAYRGAACEAASRWSELCMTPEYFAKKVMDISKLAVAKKTDLIVKACVELEQRASEAAELKTLQILAANLYMIEGENPIILTPEYLQKKIAIWTKDVDCEGFFLAKAFKSLRLYNDLSDIDFISYLRNKAIQEAQTKSRLSQVLSSK